MSESTKRRNTALRGAAVAGMVGPVLFTVLWVAAGLLRPGYSHISQYGSELGVGPNAIVMNVNFLLFGLLSILFASGLPRGLGWSRYSVIGARLVAVFGAAVMGAGVFSCVPGCAGDSLPQLMHNLVSLVAFIAISVAPLAVARGLKEDSHWGYRSYSLATGIAAFILLFITFVGASSEWVGMFQRLFLSVPLLWIEITAIRLFFFVPPV